MPSLKDLLGRTLLFSAATGARLDAYAGKKKASDPIAFSTATIPTTPAPDRAIWHWVHDPATPAKITELKCNMMPMGMGGAMAMPVCDRIEVTRASVIIDPGSDPVPLPLTSPFVVAKFFLDHGGVAASSTGWWQLEANVDASILVVFAYEFVPDTGVMKPLPLDAIERLGRPFFPVPDVPAGDPDAPPADWSTDPTMPPGWASTGQRTFLYVAPTWIILAFELVTCKQRADFEPGALLSAGRVHPHVMITCNHSLVQVEATIAIDRPASTMKHDPEMGVDVGAMFVTDTNESHGLLPGPPLPTWSSLFDYYDTHPTPGVELTMVDPRRDTRRSVTGAIQREHTSVPTRTAGMYEASTTFVKVPGQGDFDNLHLAPRMTFTSGPGGAGLSISDIAMAPICVHDCFHTHWRWGVADGKPQPKWVKGFDGRRPFAKDGAPTVPADQTVYLKLTSKHSFEYRGVQRGAIRPSTWTVVNHHGSAYALGIESSITMMAARKTVQALCGTFSEPYTTNALLLGYTKVDDVDPLSSWAAFYQRLQFTGFGSWSPRIKILDLPKCRAA